MSAHLLMPFIDETSLSNEMSSLDVAFFLISYHVNIWCNAASWCHITTRCHAAIQGDATCDDMTLLLRHITHDVMPPCQIAFWWHDIILCRVILCIMSPYHVGSPTDVISAHCVCYFTFWCQVATLRASCHHTMWGHLLMSYRHNACVMSPSDVTLPHCVCHVTFCFHVLSLSCKTKIKQNISSHLNLYWHSDTWHSDIWHCMTRWENALRNKNKTWDN